MLPPLCFKVINIIITLFKYFSLNLFKNAFNALFWSSKKKAKTKSKGHVLLLLQSYYSSWICWCGYCSWLHYLLFMWIIYNLISLTITADLFGQSTDHPPTEVIENFCKTVFIFSNATFKVISRKRTFMFVNLHQLTNNFKKKLNLYVI